MQNEGLALCLGPDIDTDLIIAGRYLRTKDRKVWAEHAFEDLDPKIAGKLNGAILVAGKNFGCGSSREQAPIALREAGVIAVIAPSFARIFFRNAINLGLPVLEADFTCSDGEKVAFSLDGGWISSGDRKVDVKPLSPKMQKILLSGGLVELWRKRD